MTEVIARDHIGENPDTRTQFELLKEGLRQHSQQNHLARQLTGRLRIAADALLLVATEQQDAEMRTVGVTEPEYHYGLTALALEPFMQRGKSAYNPWAAPSHMKFARARLAEYIMENPHERGILKQTVFFDGEARQRTFARSLSAAIRPLDDYTPLLLAERLVASEISLER